MEYPMNISQIAYPFLAHYSIQKVFHHQRGQRTTSYRTEEVQIAFRFNFGIGATVFHRQDHVVFVELESIITNWDDAEEVNAVCELVVETIASGLMISPV